MITQRELKTLHRDIVETTLERSDVDPKGEVFISLIKNLALHKF